MATTPSDLLKKAAKHLEDYVVALEDKASDLERSEPDTCKNVKARAVEVRKTISELKCLAYIVK